MKNHEHFVETKEISRRRFIATAGLAATGGILVSGAVALAVGPENTVSVPMAGDWPWVKLDPQQAAERAFRNYHAKGG